MKRTLISSLIVLCAATTAHADETTAYVVKAGDTCLGVAIRELGDRTGYHEIHRLNPGLGPLPHVLKPGLVLVLPQRRSGPDARLTGKSGDVRVRRPAEEVWDAAQRGMELFRAWRVGAQERASAEVTFSDTRRLYLREHTIVIIYGPALTRARVSTTEAALERGTLRTRLAELSGGSVRVTTPTAVATAGDGSALVSVADDGASTVANHEGKPVELRGIAGGKIAVKPGMGSRVKRGRTPDKPRALLPPPEWQPGLAHAFAAPSGPGTGASGGATVRAAWYPVAKAAWYRLEIIGPGGVVVLAAEVPHTVTSLELRDTPPGAYQASVAAIDADRFEGRPGQPLALAVVAVPVSSPGLIATVPAATDPDAPLPAPAAERAAPPAVPVLAIGATVGDRDLACEAHGRDGAPLVLVSAGPTTLVCTTSGGVMLEPFAVEVSAVTAVPSGGGTLALVRGRQAEVELRLEGAAALGEHWKVSGGPGLTVAAVAARPGPPVGLTVTVSAAAGAPPTSTLTVLDEHSGARVAVLDVTIGDAPPIAWVSGGAVVPRRRHVTVGAYAGWTSFPTGAIEGSELGDAPLDSYQVASGAGAGMRLAYWLDADLFLEADLALLPTGFVGADEPAWIASGHAYVGLQAIDGPRIGLRGVLGAGGYALLGDAPYARADLDADVAYGLTATVRLSRDFALRLDGRHHIAPDRGDGGVTDVLEATVGIEAVLRRTAAP